MRIHEGIVKCVGFIGEPSSTGFVADGTCFLVGVIEETEYFTYIVSARHLVRPIKFGKELLPLDGIVAVRFSCINQPPFILKTKRESWVTHSDRHIDLCIRHLDYNEIPNEVDIDYGSLTVIGENDVLLTGVSAQIYGPLGIGDEIFIPSLFPGHVGERTNIPVVRFGHIAAPPLEAIRRGSPTVPAYLIETKSLGGISGAPVLLHLDPTSAGKTPHITVGPRLNPKMEPNREIPYALIGMVLGLHDGQYAADFIQTDAEEAIIGKDVDFNAGISVVLPIQHVVDMLESAPFKDARMAALRDIDKRSGYRPASRRPSFPPADDPPTTEADDANPDHLEDFTRLVGAASKRKPKGDRT